MIKEEIKKSLLNSIKSLQKKGVFEKFEIPKISVESSNEESHGDYSTNVCFKLSKILRKNPKEIAEELSKEIKSGLFERVEPFNGFVNFFVSKKYFQKQVKDILKQKNKFGSLKVGKNKKINVEFISANPTGPLTLGNGRGGFYGDVLANILNKAGFNAKKEYYINDRGEQIIKLGHSIIGDEQAVYKGKYIDDLRKKIKEKDIKESGEKAVQIILKEMIKPSVKKMGIKFDKWFSEKELYENKEVEKTLDFLKNKGLSYEKDNALWFKSTNFGDDKDRVLIKESKEKTYLSSDIAYLQNKFKRGFKKNIFFWGADHYGYIERIKSAAEALGHKKEDVVVITMQLVRLFENKKEVKMSKRMGTYITIDELIGEVGLDASRFFFLMRNAGSHLNFDMNLAKEKSEKNPVYYAQYAYARICSIFKKAKGLKPLALNLKLLNHQSEINLIKKLLEFPEIIKDTAEDYQVQRLPQYAVELADSFHKFYENCRVICESRGLSESRLALAQSAKIVFKNTFDLMGISAPEKM